jgi:hypothetical protein
VKLVADSLVEWCNFCDHGVYCCGDFGSRTLRAQVVHASGYPQPERDFLYLEQAYDLSARCPKCGEGAVQVAPFRIKKTLKWGGMPF